MNTKHFMDLDSVGDIKQSKLVMMNLEQDDLGLHDHLFFELAYVVKGTATHTLNGHQHTLQKGDYFFIDFGSCHSYQNNQNLILINCLFLPEFIDETLQGCRSFQELLHVCMLRYYRITLGQNWADRIYQDTDGKVGRLLQDMVEEFAEKQLGSQEIFRCKLTEIMIHTLRKLIATPTQYSYSSTVNEILRFIDKHYSKPMSLQEFCDANHYNLSYLSRRFKQETGRTFREHVQKVRIEKCCELLSATDMTVSEIAQSVGYEDLQFFHSVFKKLLHMTPREYRKLRKGME